MRFRPFEINLLISVEAFIRLNVFYGNTRGQIYFNIVFKRSIRLAKDKLTWSTWAAVAQWGKGVVLQPRGCRFDPGSPH